MRLLAWNIRQGGGSRLPRIAEALKRHDAEIVVFSEYRGGLLELALSLPPKFAICLPHVRPIDRRNERIDSPRSRPVIHMIGVLIHIER